MEIKIKEPACFVCKHFLGNAEGKYYCMAFPEEGIPEEMISGENRHQKPYPGDNDIQFELFGEEEEESKEVEVTLTEAIKQLGDRLEQGLINRPQLIQVELPKPRKQIKRVVRDETGKILAIEEGEIDEPDNGKRMQ